MRRFSFEFGTGFVARPPRDRWLDRKLRALKNVHSESAIGTLNPAIRSALPLDFQLV